MKTRRSTPLANVLLGDGSTDRTFFGQCCHPNAHHAPHKRTVAEMKVRNRIDAASGFIFRVKCNAHNRLKEVQPLGLRKVTPPAVAFVSRLKRSHRNSGDFRFWPKTDLSLRSPHVGC